MSFPPDFLDTLRARISLADLIGRRVTWDARKTKLHKRDYWACCPFHGEKSASFHVEDAKGFYHCFGCGASGDAITFLQTLDGLSFPEAVEKLAQEAGLPVPQQDPRAEAQRVRRQTLSDAVSLAARFFQAELHSPRGAEARRYLGERGCGPELWETFGLGFAPGRTALREHLAGQKVPAELMREAGLTVESDEGADYDRFRSRLMFPIADERGRLVGFGGRILGADNGGAKYLNSPETPLFRKGHLLFNYARAREAARGAPLVVVEGYMDVVALHGAGVPNAVAPLGTALTVEQLELLWRACGEPILCFDGDEAGQRAAARAADLALPLVKAGRSVRFAVLPEGLDPDDLVRAQGPEAFRALIEAPVPLIDMLWERERLAQPVDTPERKADLERRLRARIKSIADADVRTHYARELRARVDAYFARDVGPAGPEPPKGRARRPGRGAWAPPGGGGASLDLKRTVLGQGARTMDPFLADAEAELVLLLVDHPGLLEAHAEALSALAFHGSQLDKIARELIHLASLGGGLDRVSVRDHLNSQGLRESLEALGARDIVRRRRRFWAELCETEAETVWRRAFERRVRTPELKAEMEGKERELIEDPSNGDVRRHYEALKAEWAALVGGAEQASPLLSA